MNRRLFLASLASVAAASSALLTGCATTGLVSYRQAISRGRLSLRVADYPELGNDGGAIEITTDDVADPIVIVRERRSEYVALLPVCTHLGCTVRKEPSVFRCPCHGSTYALDGTVVRGPAEKSLARFRTEFTDGLVTVHVR